MSQFDSSAKADLTETGTAEDQMKSHGLLQGSLPGEYLSLGMVIHALFGSLIWAVMAIQSPESLVVVAAGLWIGIRASGAFAKRSFCFLISSILLVGLIGLNQQDIHQPFAALAIFSLPLFIVMLVLILSLDVIGLAGSPFGQKVARRLMRWNWYRVAVWAFILTFIVYMVIIPTTGWILESMKPPPTSGEIVEGASLSEKIRLRSMEALMAFIFFGFGASIGSFLNVVVFRMPRGESVVWKPSSCPGCGSKIEGRDNVPILGWLLLNGKCRNCRQSISKRYPIVELIAGTIFLTLYFSELISGGDNIPVRNPNGYRGVVWIIFYTKWDLVSIYLFHCFALSSLLTWALIDIDRQRIHREELSNDDFKLTRIPVWATVATCLILMVAAYLLPYLMPVPWQLDTALGLTWSKEISSLGTALTGGLIGAAIGWLASIGTTATISTQSEELYIPLSRSDETIGLENSTTDDIGENSGEAAVHVKSLTEEPDNAKTVLIRSHVLGAGAIAGLALGWQAVLGVWLLAFALRPIFNWLAKCSNINQPPMTTVLLVAFFVQLLAWRALTVSWWPSYMTSTVTWIVSLVALGGLVAWNWSMSTKLKLQPETNAMIEKSREIESVINPSEDPLHEAESDFRSQEQELPNQIESDPAGQE